MSEPEKVPPAEPCKNMVEFIKSSELARNVLATMVPVGHKVRFELYRPFEGEYTGKMEVLNKLTKKQQKIVDESSS